MEVMAIFCGDRSSKAAITAVSDFKKECLIDGGSLFTSESVWTPDCVEELVVYFVENLDEGEGDFFSKLKVQLAEASPQAKILASEMMWFMLLCPSNIGAETSRKNIQQVFEFSGQKFSEISTDIYDKYLNSDVLSGIGSAGTAYNTGRWRELCYFINITKKLLLLPQKERITLLDDYQKFSLWLEQVPENEQRQLRHMLLYLFYPEFHERIFGNTDRKAILIQCTDITSAQFNKMKTREADQRLYKLRQKFEKEFETKELDYYDVAPLRRLWKGDLNKPLITEPKGDYTVMTKTRELSAPNLNQILYGPPGTGKTYSTIIKALEIIAPQFLVENHTNRTALKAHFDSLLKANRISFVTFHQSFSYEDFVEGIKASTGESNQVSYDVEDGIFKAICDRASSSVGGVVAADSFDKAVKQLQEKCEEADKRIEMKTVRGRAFEIEFSGGATFKVFPRSTESTDPKYVASIANVRKLYLSGSKDGIYNSSYVEGFLLYLKQHLGVKDPESNTVKSSAKEQPFVLIIDEINRGNIANIFGELITLIEPSKRAGGEETITVKLPYSKTPFSVPSNLFLIGTMNTADKSLAQVDIALRRRFEFIEMMTDYDVLEDIPDIDGINIRRLVEAINKRIELLYDREHTIGHSFFLPLKDQPEIKKLASIFELQILPLLEEYFFEDWERVGQVLGDHLKSDNNLRFIIEKFESSEISKLMGDEWELPGIQPYIRNEAALTDPLAYIGIYEPIN
jgi:5-methylcytosine-specific restriction protein B|tara:strand:- start:2502 stop:4727 length:2226 start_codon:yes stop_codon:yes gene_type:complete